MRYLERTVNYYETDQMSIVHHSNYIRYFEEGRVAFMDQVGYPYARLEEEEIVSPTISVSCRYLHPLRFGDTMRIGVKLVKITKLKCFFHYEITNAVTGEICAKGTTEHGFLNSEGKPVILPKDKPEFYQAFLAELEPEE